MFDVYIGSINIGLILLILSIAVLIPVQLLLCFKAKHLFQKLIPAILFTLSSIVFTFLAYTAMDWSGLFYIICAVYSAIALVMCIIGFVVWRIVRFIIK